MTTLTTLTTPLTPLTTQTPALPYSDSAQAASLERDAQRLAANIRAVDGVVPADVDCIRETVMKYRSAVWTRMPAVFAMREKRKKKKAEDGMDEVVAEQMGLPSPISPADRRNGAGSGAKTGADIVGTGIAASGTQRNGSEKVGPNNGFASDKTLTGGKHNEGVKKMLQGLPAKRTRREAVRRGLK